MKNLLMSFLVICVLATNLNFIFAAPVVVTVCGESETGNKSAALEDAKKKAVRRVLAKMTAPNRDPKSAFQKILLLFKNFAGEPKVFEQKSEGKKIFLMSKVEVDTDGLLQAVNREIKSVQIQNNDQQAIFLVRVKGLPTALFQQSWDNLLKTYQDIFEQRGFSVASNIDELHGEFRKYDRENFDKFYRQLIDKIKTDYPEITVAIVGEITISREQENDTGRLIRSDVNISAVDVVNDKLITKFSDVHKLKASAEGGAVFDALLQKSVYSSATYLSDRTVSYWQNL